jgi:hypothetical protein
MNSFSVDENNPRLFISFGFDSCIGFLVARQLATFVQFSRNAVTGKQYGMQRKWNMPFNGLFRRPTMPKFPVKRAILYVYAT